MEKSLHDFIALLRDNGCRVSTAEAADCFNAVCETGFADREVFRSTLRATLVKTPVDADTFDHLFDLFFVNVFAGLDAVRGPGSEKTARELLERAGMAPDELSPLALALLDGDTAALQALMTEAAGQTGAAGIYMSFQEGLFTLRMLEALGWNAVAEQLRGVAAAAGARGSGASQRSDLEFIDGVLQRFPETVRSYVERMRKQNWKTRQSQPNPAALFDKSFHSLTAEEKRWIKEAIRKLAEKMRTALSTRTKAWRRGKLNIPKTLRKNAATGGVPFYPVFDRRRKRKRQVIVLCDVSSSVGYAARLMLHFVYSLQELFTRVRSFVFVSDIAEVTGLFEREESDAAFDSIMKNKLINTASYTNYGEALAKFDERWGRSVDRKTTLIILGDARTNFADPRAETLRSLSRRAHRVFWLNPEQDCHWNHDDSVVYAYEPYCDEIFEIRNTRQLLRAVERIAKVKPGPGRRSAPRAEKVPEFSRFF